MQPALDVFLQNLERAKSLHALYLNLSASVKPIIDITDLLRSEMVLVVSALDQFVHELTRSGMMEIWNGTRGETPSYVKFTVSLGVVAQLMNIPRIDSHLDAEIRTRHSFLAFQHPDRIADAVRLFSKSELWNQVAKVLGEDAEVVKARLKLIVDRRNKIAHEADIDPSFPGQRWPISRQDVEDTLRFVSEVGAAIFQVVK